MKILDTYNAAAGAVIAVLSYIFGEHWALFALFLAFNIADWLIGTTLGINLEITVLLGWFVLASLIVNELRSILENFVEMGYNVPRILTKGLEVADKAINQSQDDE